MRRGLAPADVTPAAVVWRAGGEGHPSSVMVAGNMYKTCIWAGGLVCTCCSSICCRLGRCSCWPPMTAPAGGQPYQPSSRKMLLDNTALFFFSHFLCLFVSLTLIFLLQIIYMLLYCSQRQGLLPGLCGTNGEPLICLTVMLSFLISGMCPELTSEAMMVT